MPKNSKKQIIEDEKKVLEILMQNSNQSIDELAKNCNFSTQKLLRIKKRLEKNNIIWGYSAITDYNNLDLKHYTVLFKRTTNPLNKEIVDDVTKGFLENRFPEGKITIENVLYVHGEYDWIVSFSTPNTLTMKQFCDRLIKIFGDFISDYSIHQTIIPIRKQGIKNPNASKQRDFL
ncbi:MAG: hypothetical protein AYK22_06110 [Thermoplasmatales archaeon SG8-52-3]|nr:MAG: hypothetical protein AYK22_06110 [Thermoplasmatales archaeon SG8-52-3]